MSIAVRHFLPVYDNDRQPHWSMALKWALLMGAMFFLIYGSVNAYSANYTVAPSLYLPWERQIPFVPSLIVPYMSIDLIFVLCFFLCRNHYELISLSWRIGFAVVVSALCFLLFPMKFGFERPVVDGAFSFLFFVHSVDLPYNQCPSLHISIAMILWDVLRRRLQGRPLQNILVTVWFVLIAASTVLVFQHHVIDVAGGVIVGLLSWYLFPFDRQLKPEYQPQTRQHVKPGLLYLLSGIALALIAATLGDWFVLLLYPAVSLCLVASAYLSARSNFLQKHQGRIPWSMQLLFAPYLQVVCWTWKFHKYRDQAYTRVGCGLVLGRRLSKKELLGLQAEGVVAVIDLAPEVKSRFPRQMDYLHLPVLDFTRPTAGQVEQAARFVARHRQGKVYIHCALGYLRSAQLVLALLKRSGQNPKTAAELLRRLRPACKVTVPGV